MGVFSYIGKLAKYYTFSVVCFLYIFNPKNYNPASREIIVQQIYFTAIEILPIFLFSAVFFGALIMGITVSTAINYGMKDYIGYLIVKLILVELVPFIMALYISFRTGLRVGAKSALMKVNNEFNTLEKYDIDVVRYLFMPRAFGNTIAFTSLVFLFCVIMIVSGYVFLFLMIGMDFNIFLSTIVSAVSPKDIILLLTKSLIFGFIIITVPSYDGLTMKKRYYEIPTTLSKSILSLFFIILILEVISLIVEFI